MRIFSLTILFMLRGLALYAQQSQFLPFRIEGYINADTGTVQLDILFDSDYYPEGVDKIVAKVENKKFTLSGNIPYPQGVILSYGQEFYTSLFVIEQGIQTVVCNVDEAREVPKVSNRAMKEYEEEYVVAFEPVKRKRELYKIKRDSLTQLYQKKIPASIQLDLEQELKGYYTESDSVRLLYASTHPDSYLAFWNFIYLFSGFGYESIFDSIYTQFSDSLKNTYAGEVLSKKLEVASMLDYGKEFPLVPAIDAQKKELNYSSFLNNRYTFVDFWYSNCHPCISQFPHLKEIYKIYKDKGFQIIGISTDRVRYEKNWLAAVQKYQLSWLQYWDKDGVEASKLSINNFPTNYLLDSKGNIIKKDLRPVELEQFLRENMQ